MYMLYIIPNKQNQTNDNDGGRFIKSVELLQGHMMPIGVASSAGELLILCWLMHDFNNNHGNLPRAE